MRQYHDLASDVLSGGTAGAGIIILDGVGNALGRPDQSRLAEGICRGESSSIKSSLDTWSELIHQTPERSA